MDGDAGRKSLASNARVASTVIVLCIVAMTAVVLVHKEANLGTDTHDFVVERENSFADTPTEAKFERDFEEMMFLEEEQHAKRRHSGGEVVRLELSHPATGPLDTPTPIHADTKHKGQAPDYGVNEGQFAKTAVRQAQATAAKAIKDGQTHSFKVAQDSSTSAIVKKGRVPPPPPSVYERTIAAAKYSAKSAAVAALESGMSPVEAEKAAEAAAQGLVNDKGAAPLAVPVPNHLARLLSNVDVLWAKMKGKLNNVKDIIKHTGKHCPKEKKAVKAAHKKMKAAMAKAKEHIAASKHAAKKVATKKHAEIALVQVEATAPAQRRSATEAHMAEGFLDMVKELHSQAYSIKLRCRAERTLKRFGHSPDDLKKIANAFQGKTNEARAKAHERRQKTLDAEANLAKAQGRYGLMSNAMGSMLFYQMSKSANHAAMAALKTYRGSHSVRVAKKAAEAACVKTLKTVAKGLAQRMAAMAAGGATTKRNAMKKAIVTVLQVGRPLEPKIVADAVRRAVNWELEMRKRAFPADKSPTGGLSWPTTKKPGSEVYRWPVGRPTGSAQPWPSDLVDERRLKKAQHERKMKVMETRAKRLKRKVAEKKRKEGHAKELGNKETKTKALQKQVTLEKHQKVVVVKQHRAELNTKIKAAKAAAAKRVAETHQKHLASERAFKLAKVKKLASTKSAGDVWRSAKEATIKAGQSKEVAAAKAAMEKAVTNAAAKAAEKARIAVAKAGGNIQQQLKAAAAAAADASKKAAALSGKEVQATARRAVRAHVMRAAKKAGATAATTAAKTLASSKVGAAVTAPPVEKGRNVAKAIKKQLKKEDKKVKAVKKLKDIAAPQATTVPKVTKPKTVKRKVVLTSTHTVEKKTTPKDTIKKEKRKVQNELQAAAAKALQKLTKSHQYEESKVRKTVHGAVWSVLAQAINRSASQAAVVAVNKAKLAGKDSAHSQEDVVKAAQTAALAAKSMGLPLANAAVERAVRKAKSAGEAYASLEMLE